MAVLTLHKATKAFGARALFEGLDLEVAPGTKIGLVGPNGCGKTTLLRAIAGLEPFDGGTCVRARDTTLGYLRQDVSFGPEETVLTAALRAFAPLTALETEMQVLAEAMSAGGPQAEGALQQYGALQQRFEAQGGYTTESRAREVLAGLGFAAARLEEPCAVLSGGERVRLALATLLLQAPDILLLDEPTNHLDLPATTWLEAHLRRSPAAALLVSHDRYFLDAVTGAVLEVAKRPRLFRGNYSQYLRLRVDGEAGEVEAYRRAQLELPHVREVIRSFQLRWERPPKHWVKRLQQLESVPAPRLDVRTIQPQALAPAPASGQGQSAAGTAGALLLELSGLQKAYAHDLYGPQGFSTRVLRGERVGLVGPNGSGKSTLLRLLLGDGEPDAGAYGWADGTRTGWLPQSLEGLDPDLTLVQQLTAVPGLGERAARAALARFLFEDDNVFRRTGDCSGGERCRVALCRLLLQPWDVLLLDEPTNHLDMESRRALEDALVGDTRTVLVASHDRFFLDQVCGRLWVFGAGAVVDFDGNYSAWVASQASGSVPEERGEAAALAAAIRVAEARAATLRARLSQASTFERGHGRRLAAEWKAGQAELADLQRRWRRAARGAPS